MMTKDPCCLHHTSLLDKSSESYPTSRKEMERIKASDLSGVRPGSNMSLPLTFCHPELGV
jgi:hypothetical protein